MNDSHGFPWYTIPMVTINRRKVIHIVGCGDAERSMDFEAKKTKGLSRRREVTRSFGTENNQEINMQGRPFQRSLNGVMGGVFSIFSRK